MKDTDVHDIIFLINDKYTGEVFGIFQGLEMSIGYMIEGEFVTTKKYQAHLFSKKLEDLTNE